MKQALRWPASFYTCNTRCENLNFTRYNQEYPWFS